MIRKRALAGTSLFAFLSKKGDENYGLSTDKTRDLINTNQKITIANN